MNLLLDPVFTVNDGQQLSLPELFAESAKGNVRAFVRLRAHQRTAWHMFRVQLAALALRQADLKEPPTDHEHWIDLLRALTVEHGDDPWCLVVKDSTRPAFLQPPDPGGLKWNAVATPDALDLLITARNHDVKRAIAQDPVMEDWAYALMSLQTSDGSGGGRGGYRGIARMSKGSSSRPFLGLARADGAGCIDLSSWWSRDLRVLISHQNEDTPLTPGGLALLWCLEWKDGQPIPAQDLDPWAIEVCRRIRLTSTADGRIKAVRSTAKKARVDAESFHGVLGDPWAPVSLNDAVSKALMLGDRDFNYQMIEELLLSGNWKVPLAAQVHAGEEAGDMVLLAEALSRGNSKTAGLKSRTIVLPARARGLLRTQLKRVAETAALQTQEIADTNKALSAAIALFAVRGEREKLDDSKEKKRAYQRAATANKRLEQAADKIFFEHLWLRTDQSNDTAADQTPAAIEFKSVLASVAREELKRAFSMIPCASLYAPRARVRAISRLESKLAFAGITK